MKVYEVVSRYIDGRSSTFCLNEIESENVPCNTFVSLKTRDIYHDYFISKEDAEKFIEDSKSKEDVTNFIEDSKKRLV